MQQQKSIQNPGKGLADAGTFPAGGTDTAAETAKASAETAAGTPPPRNRVHTNHNGNGNHNRNRNSDSGNGNDNGDCHKKTSETGKFGRVTKAAERFFMGGQAYGQVHGQAQTRSKQIRKALCVAGAAFLLGQCQLPFGCYPLGLAFLCALPENLLPALAGVVIAAITVNPAAPTAPETPDGGGIAPVVFLLITVAIAAAFLRGMGNLLCESSRAGKDPEISASGKMNARLPAGIGAQFRAILQIGKPLSYGEEVSEPAETGDQSPPHSFQDHMLGEPLALRMCCAAICATAVGFCTCIAGGFRLYDLLGMGVSILACVGAVPIFAIAAEPMFALSPASAEDGAKAQRSAQTAWLLHNLPGKLAALACIMLLVYSARGLTLFGISLGIAGGILACAEAVRRYGVIPGLILSLAVGVAYSPQGIPVFVLAAIFFALFDGLSRTVGLFTGAAAATAYGVRLSGFAGALAVLPAALLAVTVSEILARREAVQKQSASQAEANRGRSTASQRQSEGGADRQERINRQDGMLILKNRKDAMEERLRDLSGAFSSLSEMFFNLSDRIRRPALLDLRHVCDGVFERTCEGCPDREICWGLEYEKTMDALSKLTSSLYTKGVADTERLDPDLLRRCSRMDKILSGMNEACARLTGEALRGCRTEIFALDYEALSRILSEALEYDDRAYECDPCLGNKVAAALDQAGLSVDGVAAFGGGRRRVLAKGVDLLRAQTDAGAIQTAVEEACGIRMSRPVFEMTDGSSVMYMCARRRYSVRHAERTVPSGEEGSVCGDSVSAFSGKEDRFCALICDGMGRGKEAALTSGIASVFLEKMLTAGNRAATSVKMLNTLMRSGGTPCKECSVTVDLCELDLFTGSASFLKSGAAPSFVVRSGKVFRLEARTFPVGILGAVDASVIRFDLLPGDMIFMVSDGVSDALGTRLPDLLKSLCHDPDRAAEELLAMVRIADRTAEDSDDQSTDDQSVVVLCIDRAAEE